MLLNGENTFRLHVHPELQIALLEEGGSNKNTNVSVSNTLTGHTDDAVLDSDLLNLFLLLAAEIKTVRNYFPYRSNAAGL
jgi:hypothetical protein